MSEGHHKQSFWSKYIWSTDHKVIGIQYGITALIWLLFGFVLISIMRYQIAYPGTPIPLIGSLLGPDGALPPETYNSMGAMHGTIMIFLGVVPLAFGAFGNYFVPLQIGAIDMAFPKLNAASYWMYFLGSVIMVIGFCTRWSSKFWMDFISSFIKYCNNGSNRLVMGNGYVNNIFIIRIS